MSLCRVDTDRLRGLASQLGSTAVALGDAAPAAGLLAMYGSAFEAGCVAATLTHSVEFIAGWQASLLERAAVLDREHAIFVAPSFATPGQLREVEILAVLATHRTAAAPPFPSAGGRREDVAAAVATVKRLVAEQAPPADVAALFAGIGGDLAMMVAVAEPATIGSLGGVPLPLRFLANRLLVSRARTAVRRALQLEKERPRSLLDQLAVLDEFDDGSRQFVVFDWEAERVVEWIGPVGASHVAVYVPGAGVGRREFPELATRLRRVTELDPSGGDLAVVAALAYATPPTVLHATLGSYADEGGPEVVDLFRSLDLAGRHVSLVGHSYGSVVVGEALRRGAASVLPDGFDVIVLGSPGVRADHVSELGMSGDRFWAALLPGDEIAGALHPSRLPKLAACMAFGLDRVVEGCWAGDELIHGINPAAEHFGASLLETTVGGSFGSSHSDYLATTRVDGTLRPSPTLRDLLRIVVGHPPRAR